MGLLSFRKKSAVEETEVEEVEGEVQPFDLSDEDWLSGVERRDEVPASEQVEPTDPAYNYPTEQTADVPVEAAAADDLVVAAGEVAPAAEPFVPASAMPADAMVVPEVSPMGAPTTYPDMGMVYSGLESEGITSFASETPTAFASETSARTEPLAVTHSGMRTIADGPLGPEAAPLLQTLGLSGGCSWMDVTLARRAIMAAIPRTGAPEEAQARSEVNHATASLRLLRLGPLKF